MAYQRLRDDESDRQLKKDETQLKILAENIIIRQKQMDKQHSEQQSKHERHEKTFEKMAKDQMHHLSGKLAAEKRKATSEWENERARRSRESPSIFGSSSAGDSNRNTLGKNKKTPTENIALRLLAEHKQKMAKKQRERELAEREEYVTRKALFEAGQRETPLPPYAKSLYNIPEEIQEKLEMKRLYDALMSLSDPETTRRRNIYPEIQDELEYATEFKGLREWATYQKSLARRNSEEAMEAISDEDTNDESSYVPWEGISFPGYYNDLSVEERNSRMYNNKATNKKVLKVNIATREKVRAKTLIHSSTDSSDEGDLLRMRGGKGSNESTPFTTPNNKTNSQPTNNALTTNAPGGSSQPNMVVEELSDDDSPSVRPPAPLPKAPARLASLQVNPERYPSAPQPGNTPYHLAQISPRLVPLNTDDVVTDSDADCLNRPSKRKKTAESLRIRDDDNPGLSQSEILGLSQEARRLGTKLLTILVTEKEKKKISTATYRDLSTIRETYQSIIDELCNENALLSGRLLEARKTTRMAEAKLEQLSSGPRQPVPTPRNQERNQELDDIVRLYDEPRKPVKERLGPKPKKNPVNMGASTSRQVPATETPMDTDIAPTSQSEAEPNCPGPTWTDVVKRKSKKKKRVQITEATTATSGDEDRQKTNDQLRKEKLNKLKEVQPPKSFVIKVGDKAGINAVKTQLWADVLKNTNGPKISATRVTKKGDLLITPADDTTYRALERIAESRNDMSKEAARWPHVMLPNVDTSQSPEDLVESIAVQNPHLGLSAQEASDNIKPLYKTGPRDRDTVNWVCMVNPNIFDRFLTSRLYIGFTSCWAKEKFDYSQCLTCLRYGHRSGNCPNGKITCAHCGKEDHKAEVCSKKEDPPKCVNCKGAHSALSGLCKDRNRAIEMAVKRTDYAKN